MAPDDPVTLQKAAAILGCTVASVHTYIADGQLVADGNYRELGLERAYVQALATDLHGWLRLRHDSDCRWMTGPQAVGALA